MDESDDGDDVDKAQDDEINNLTKVNPELAKDILKAREDMKKKREAFEANMDENLSEEERK